CHQLYQSGRGQHHQRGEHQSTHRRLAMTRRALIACAVLALFSLSASADEYIVALNRQHPAITDSEVATLGGAVISRTYDRVHIALSPQRLDELKQNAAVAYVQHVGGESTREMLPTEKTEEPIRSRHAATPMFAPPTWSSGTYSYDGTGNISAIGQASDGSSNTYIYDEDSRLKTWRLAAGPNPRSESYAYDVYGNMTSIQVNSVTTSISVDANTNRLTSRDYTSQGPGNLVDPYVGQTLAYDALSMPTKKTVNGIDSTYIYTVDDERIGILM